MVQALYRGLELTPDLVRGGSYQARRAAAYGSIADLVPTDTNLALLTFPGSCDVSVGHFRPGRARRSKSWTPAGWVGCGCWTRCGATEGQRGRPPDRRGRLVDVEAVERVLFALVAQRALEPGSKLAATRWVAERVAIKGLTEVSDDQAYRGMDFLLDALGEIAGEVFASVAHLLNLDLDIVFVDTTSTYWSVDTADDLADLGDPVTGDDGTSRPVEQAVRAFGHSKDHRPDLPQVVIAMAVTRDGVPVRCWTFPGNTGDQGIIRTIKDDLGGWGLRRMVWVADRGFASATNRAYLTRGGGHYIHAEKLRHTNTEASAALARPGRYATVAGNLRVKEVHVAPGGTSDGDGGARAVRFVVCHNPDQATRDQAVRTQLVEHLQSLIEARTPGPRAGATSSSGA